jgi:guanylate kinase
VKHIYIFIGPAAIGKSTFIKNEMDFKGEKHIVISRDDIVDEICDRYGLTYDEMFYYPPADAPIGSLVPGFEKYGKVIESPDMVKHICPVSYETLNSINTEVYYRFKGELEDAFEDDEIKHIILDRVHMKKSEREYYFTFDAIKQHREKFFISAILFNFKDPDALDLIEELSKRRSKLIEETGRKKTITREIQERMIKWYTEPTLEEGFDEIIEVDTLPKLRELVNSPQ